MRATVPEDFADPSVEAVLDLLASAGRLLTSAVEYEAALPGMCALLVPQWADGCAVALAGEDGSLRTVAHVGIAPGVRHIDHARWTLDVPIAARTERFGFLRLTGPGQSPPTLLSPLASELAARVANAVDTARTIAREHHVADTLQRALLPERLPQSRHASFDAAYRPGASESIVGGDWYDAFELPDGRVAFSIGDVAGHGLSAAVVMSEVRQAVRASALAATTPSEVLARANQMLTMGPAPTMVTALFGFFEPRSSRFVYASAGHPAPLLGSPCGIVQNLPSGGLPLGVVDDVEAVDWTFSLTPGSLLVLYTDGLIEYGRDVFAGERALVRALAEEMRAPTEFPAKSVQDRVFSGVGNTDDVATLTLFVPPRTQSDFVFEFSAIPLAAPMARRAMERFITGLSLDEDRRFALITAVGEAVANAIEHAYGGGPGIVRIEAAREGAGVRVTIEDAGRWRAACQNEERGRGVRLMRALMDSVEIRTGASSTQVRLRLELA